MDNGSKISLDMFLTLLRYSVIAWCFRHGVTDSGVIESYANLAVAGGTALWGLYASGYWHRIVDWFRGITVVEVRIQDPETPPVPEIQVVEKDQTSGA